MDSINPDKHQRRVLMVDLGRRFDTLQACLDEHSAVDVHGRDAAVSALKMAQELRHSSASESDDSKARQLLGEAEVWVEIAERTMKLLRWI